MKKVFLSIMVFSLALGLGLTGCSKKADANKPIADINKEVQTMDLSQLESTAKAYAKEIAGKQNEVEKIMAGLKDLKPAELLGEKAKSIKEQAAKVKTDLSALTQRYNIYASKFKELGGDIGQIKIS